MPRYYPIVGEKHLHRGDDNERFQYTPVEVLAHATNWAEYNNTRWSSATILKTKTKYVYTVEHVSLWAGETLTMNVRYMICLSYW